MATAARQVDVQGGLITVSDPARDKILALLAGEGKGSDGLRIAVMGGGCSGFQYRFAFERAAGPYDLVLQFERFRLYVDQISAGYLEGSELDYVQSLMSEGFHVRNPNAKGTCGCGMSVSF